MESIEELVLLPLVKMVCSCCNVCPASTDEMYQALGEWWSATDSEDNEFVFCSDGCVKKFTEENNSLLFITR